MTEVTDADLERVRANSAKELMQHEIECERRYGEINARLDTVEVLMHRNTRLLYVVLGGMLAVVARSFWPILVGG